MTYRIMTGLVVLVWSSYLPGQTLPRHELAADLSPVLINFSPTYELMYRHHGDRQTWRGRVAFFGDFSQTQDFVVHASGLQAGQGNTIERGFTSVTVQSGWQYNRFLAPLWLYAGLDLALGWQQNFIESERNDPLANGEQLFQSSRNQSTGYTVGVIPLLGATYPLGKRLSLGVEVNLPLFATFSRSNRSQRRIQRDSNGSVIGDDQVEAEGRIISYTLLGTLPEQSMLSLWASVYLPSASSK